MASANFEQFHSFFEHLPVGAYRTSYDGKFLIANQALVKIFGCNSIEELLQKNANDFYIDTHTRQNTFEQ
ncbi:MAG: PAS domain-containing protein, partial [FCB group bacterium]